jgi:long-subunit acyl-CoA synthetase (AMP-forming)
MRKIFEYGNKLIVIGSKRKTYVLSKGNFLSPGYIRVHLVNLPYLSLLVGIRPVQSTKIVILISDDLKSVYSSSRGYSEFVSLVLGKNGVNLDHPHEVFDMPSEWQEELVIYRDM